MKTMNLKKFLTRSSFILLMLTLLTSMILTVAAEALPWELSGDEVTLTHGDETYTAFSLSVDCRLRPRTRYVYSEELDIFSSYSPYPQSYQAGGGIVWLTLSDRTVYLNPEGRDKLRGLVRGDAEIFYLATSDTMKDAPIKKSTVNRLDDMAGQSSDQYLADVREGLEFVTRYELLAYDDTETICQLYGVIYEIDGDFYYLNYQTLDNSHFDADGNFSYRSGTVVLTKIGTGTEQTVRDVIADMTYFQAKVSYEEGEEFTPNPYGYNPLVFWFMYIAIGFVMPCVPLALGLILPRISKMGKPVYWYSLAIAAGVWLLSAIVILILLL